MRLIDADALMERLKAWDTDDIVDRRLYNFTLSRVLEQPTIESERKTGSWKRITEGRIPELYICPFCHRTIEDEGIEYMVTMRYPFCHCGADMRGEQDK